MARVDELRDQRGRALQEARSIAEKAAGEKRVKTDDEQRQYDLHIGDVSKLGKEIDDEVRLLETERELATVAVRTAAKQSGTEKPVEDKFTINFRKMILDGERSLNNEAERKISFIKKFSKRSSTLLDVGAGLGNFAVCASYNGFKVEILDRSKWAVGYVKKNFNIEGYVSTLYESKLPEAKFDIVTAWDVIEHLTNPLLGFKTLNMLLKRSGFLFLTTPNIDSIDSKILGKRWYGFKKIPEHVVYFSPSTIRLFAKRAGFEVLEIKNWGFVRNWQFMADKLKIYNARLGGLFEKQLKFIGIQNKDVYFPFIDMMVVLKKR